MTKLIPAYNLATPEEWTQDKANPYVYAVEIDGHMAGYVYRQYYPQERKQTWAFRYDARGWYGSYHTSRKGAVAAIEEMYSRNPTTGG